MPLHFLTTNQNKFAEAQRFFPDIAMLPVDLPEIQELDLQKIIEKKLEAGIQYIQQQTEEERAQTKIQQFFVEDTGLYLRCMNGFPGPLVKWMLQQMKAQGIIDLVMQHYERRATAITMLGYADLSVQPADIHYFVGEVQGMIVPPRGSNDFGWGPIFVPDNHYNTFAEMKREEKDCASMRAKAFRELREYLGKK